MSWSQDQSTYKVVFLVGDAPPHMDYQDDVKYPQVVAAAAAKGIVVNTIQCGSMSDTVAPWQHIASLGRGRYFTVEQAGSAVAIETPFDAQIATLAAELDGTRLYYGSPSSRPRWPRKSTRRRASTKRRRSRRARGAARSTSAPAAPATSWASASSSTTSRAAASTSPRVPPAQLPAAVAALPAEEQRELLAETAAEARGAQAADRGARRGARRLYRGASRRRRRRRRVAGSADLRRRARASRAARPRLRGRAALLNLTGRGRAPSVRADPPARLARSGRCGRPGVS